VIEAELAAKTVFIKGSRGGESWLNSHPRYAGLIVLENGDSLMLNNFNDHLLRVS
jgi:hypothetical protein